MDTPTSQAKVVIVEDDVFLAKAYQLEFSQFGAQVVILNDGTQAVEYLKNDPPAVVLLDLLLPGASGLDVLTAIRHDERWKTVPVIVLSNLEEEQFVSKTKDLGIDEYMVKANTHIHDVVEKAKGYISR